MLDELAPIRIVGQGAELPAVVCCAPADAASAAPRIRVRLAARHRTRWGCSIAIVRIVSSSLLPCWLPRGARGRVGRAVADHDAATESAPRTTVFVEGAAWGRNARAPKGLLVVNLEVCSTSLARTVQ